MDTQYYELILSQCESKEEYETLVREHQNLYVDWQSHLRPMLDERRLTYKQIAEGCEVSESSARSFIKKIPAKRENVIMLAMMMRLTVKQTDELLMRWAKFQKLYSRNPNDAIWIYLLKKGGSSHPRALFRDYHAAYQLVKKEYQLLNAKVPEVMNTSVFFDEIMCQANQAGAVIPGEVDERFVELMKRGMPSFEKGYQKLLSYIDSFFYDMEIEDNRRLQLQQTGNPKSRQTPNKVFGSDRCWKDTYYRKIRALEKNQVMPCRAFLIALGLRLGMDTGQLNELLNLAGMGPLCPKDRLEGTMVFYLESLSCNFPSYFNKPGSICVSEEYDLMDFSTKREAVRYEKDQLAQFEIPDITLDFEDNPVECLNDYIRRSVLGTSVFEFGYDDYIMELLELLGPNSSNEGG